MTWATSSRGQGARAQDRPVEVPTDEVCLARALGAQVAREHGVHPGFRLAARPHRGHEHVATDPRERRAVGQERGAAPVDSVLALGSAARSSARCEHDRVGTRESARDVVHGRGLEIEHDGARAVGLDVGDVIRVADESDRRVAPCDERPGQAPSDLTMPPCHHDAHGSTVERVRGSRCAHGSIPLRGRSRRSHLMVWSNSAMSGLCTRGSSCDLVARRMCQAVRSSC
jgi:hypothetical protein